MIEYHDWWEYIIWEYRLWKNITELPIKKCTMFLIGIIQQLWEFSKEMICSCLYQWIIQYFIGMLHISLVISIQPLPWNHWLINCGLFASSRIGSWLEFCWNSPWTWSIEGRKGTYALKLFSPIWKLYQNPIHWYSFMGTSGNSGLTNDVLVMLATPMRNHGIFLMGTQRDDTCPTSVP